MSDESNEKVYTADPDDPVALAEEAIEAMRATGPVSAEMERRFWEGAKRQARFIKDRIRAHEAGGVV